MTFAMIEHHTEALVNINFTALQLIEILPETDITLKLRHLLDDQKGIFECILEQRHYGSDRLDDVIDHCNAISENITEYGRIKNGLNENSGRD